MEAEKPEISILMAVYEPRLDWLREQLLSLDRQTYPNLRLYIRDDCSPSVSREEIQKCVSQSIRSFPYELHFNETNLGSNGTFQRLTQEADGDYFAYCDQDDVWLPEKLSTLQKLLEETGALLACSDMYIIDGDGAVQADSITKVRHRHTFCRTAENMEHILLYRNFVVGCTALIQSSAAKAALPFPDAMVHDHYLALYCARSGAISVCDEPLIRYRIHGRNQTGVLSGVKTKEDYYEKYIQRFCRRTRELNARFPSDEFRAALAWGEAREAHYRGERGSVRKLWRLKKNNPSMTLFELVMLRLPNSLFQFCTDFIRRNHL